LCKDDFSVIEESKEAEVVEEEEEEESFHTAVSSHSSIQSNINSPNKSYISFSPNLEDEIEEFRRCNLGSKGENSNSNSTHNTPPTIKDFPLTSTPLKNYPKFSTNSKLSKKGTESIRSLLDQYSVNITNDEEQMPNFDKLLPVSNLGGSTKTMNNNKDINIETSPIKSTPERLKKSKASKSSPFAKFGSAGPSSNNSSPSDINEDSFLSFSSESSIEFSPQNSPSKFLYFPSVSSKKFKYNLESPTEKEISNSPQLNKDNDDKNNGDEDDNDCTVAEFDLGDSNDQQLIQNSPSKSIRNIPHPIRNNYNYSPSQKLLANKSKLLGGSPTYKKLNFNQSKIASDSSQKNLDFSLDLSFIPDENRIKFHLNDQSQLDFDQHPKTIHDVDIPLIFDALQQFPPNTFDNGKRLRPSHRPKFNYPFTKKDFEFDKPLPASCFKNDGQKVCPSGASVKERELYKSFLKGQREEFREYMKGLKRKLE
jgi:hypothetical protein